MKMINIKERLESTIDSAVNKHEYLLIIAAFMVIVNRSPYVESSLLAKSLGLLFSHIKYSMDIETSNARHMRHIAIETVTLSIDAK